MFAQVIRGRVSNPELVEETFARWSKELAPAATGWLGTTGGVTDDGQLFIMVRFESEEAAQANSDRPEQGEFWAEVSKKFDGEAAFYNSIEVLTDIRGDLDSAGFVQVLHGQVSDVARSKQIGEATHEVRKAWRPDILGQVVVGYEEGKFHRISYFTNEEEAREGESKGIPEEIQPALKEMLSLSVGQPEFLDIKKPWIDSPK
jgi:hypothetical protein